MPEFTNFGFTKDTVEFKQLKGYDIYYRSTYNGYEVLQPVDKRREDIEKGYGYSYYMSNKGDIYKAVFTTELEWLKEKPKDIFDFMASDDAV